MSKIYELIKELCPRGVIYKTLDKLVSISTGKLNANAMVDEGKYAFFTCDANPFRIDTFAFDGEAILISGNGSQVGHLNYYVGKFNAYQRTYVLMNFSDELIAKYLYHYLSTYLKGYVNENSKKGSVPYITLPMLTTFKVALPPIEIQEEIVKILDEFGELEAELEAELEVRKSQYEFWHGKLLDRNVNLKPIGELFEFKNGINKSKDCFGKGNSIINYVDVYKNNRITNDIVKGLVELKDTDLNRYSCKKGDVFFTRTSETKEEVGIASVLIDDMNDSVFSGFLLRARPTTDLLIPEYCAYCFSSPRVRNDIISYANFTTRATVTGSILSKVKIYVPNIEEQKNIVKILDKMYSLITSIVDGIPAEIELRRQQYTYYRNKLLSFEELIINE